MNINNAKNDIREATRKMSELLDSGNITYKEFILSTTSVFAVAFKNLGYSEKEISEYFNVLNKNVIATLKRSGNL